MVIEQVLQEIQSLYSRGVQSDDSRLSSRQIYYTAIQKRSTVLVQQSNANQMISDWAYQSICPELKLAEAHECPCLPIKGISILRTKEKIPTLINGIDSLLFKHVGTIEGNEGFSRTTFEDAKYQLANKYTGNKSRFFIKNGYLYITNRKILQAINIQALFDDPIEVYNFKSVCTDMIEECDCIDYMKLNFPLDNKLTDNVISLTSERLIGLFLQMKEDNKNNSVDDIDTVNMVHK